MDVLPSDLAKHHVWRGGDPEKQSAIITRLYEHHVVLTLVGPKCASEKNQSV